MNPDGTGPLSRPFVVTRLPDRGAHVVVEADEAEREALAADLDLVAIGSLVATFRVQGKPERVRVTGRVEAAVTQTCVVSLDEFDSHVDEHVHVEFRVPDERERRAPPSSDGEVETDIDAPDEIVNGRIELGALAAEFLALGLDPHPRKPDAAFDQTAAGPATTSPFAALAGLKPDGE